MAFLLKKIADNALPQYNYTLNKKRAEYHLRMHRQFGSPINDEYLFKYVNELVFVGENAKVIEILEARMKERGFDTISRLNRKTHYPYFNILGMAYNQLAEDENCVIGHSSQSCIIPIKEAGVHVRTTGAKKAIAFFTKILQSFPDDLHARWMLNLSYMTLGQYPHAIPKAYLIEGIYEDHKQGFPYFPNIAGALNLDTFGLAGGICTEDFNNDGNLDVMTSSYGLTDQLRYYEYNSGNFVDKTEKAGLKGIVSGLNLVHADYDNDGFEDVLVLRGAWFKDHGRHPNSLLRNNGNGTFEDVTESSGLFSQYPTQTASWADFDLDGDLDLFIANESTERGNYPCELYQNNGDGTFIESAEKYGIEAFGFYKGAVWGDINNDSYPDLYLSNYNGLNKLYLNRKTADGQRKFEEIGKSAGVQEPYSSFPTWFFDYNNDGLEDIFVSGYDQNRLSKATIDEALEVLGRESPASKPRLYKNNGDLTFTDVTEQMGLNRAVYSMGCNFGDLDNDGWLDFYLGTGTPDLASIVPNRMYRNDQGKIYTDVTMAGGFGHIQKGHGVAFSDIDNDGDQDIYIVMGGAVSGDTFHNALFQNPGFGNNWISLSLEGTTANRSAIGTKIHITATSENDQPIKIYRVVNTGGSFGASTLRQEIGLARAVLIDELKIIWPDKQRSTNVWTNVPINNTYTIRQGDRQLHK
ncbi:CRTAC1 family protein [Fulvivirgaceae bacterium BMA10]|uniref:CRTAC1 family protein n=1 Tax=Splendidivirga corallicola TaxID=3051826 RepID=A0ABT8KVB1_9BACT|nr:CRTAC1 family protein [Fulvivirgaceae bacterium BMA10]